MQSFETSHDSVACRGYRITTPSGKVVSIATDLGFVSDEVLANLLLSDVVALEANYDEQMLLLGPYPRMLKQRIASRRGHLSNDESAQTLVRLMINGCKKFMLCHISQENNTPERARAAAAQALESLGRPVHLSVAPEQERGPLFRLENGTVSVVEEIALC